MKKHLLLVSALMLFLGLNPAPAAPFQEGAATAAPEGKQMNFQGTLYENGAPVTGERSFTFSIDLGDGSSWTETQANVQVIEGLYAVILGSINPIPEDLFYDVQGRTMTVSIGNTVLGSTELLSPFSPKPIGPIDDLPRRIEIDNTTTDSDTIFYYNISSDNLKPGSQRGLQIDMTGAGFKMAFRGNTFSQAGEGNGGIAIIGSALGEGSGNHEGVRGQAFGAGRNNSGVLGLASGPGNGATGYDEGSYNTGVVGYGQSNPWGNTGVTGYALGNQGVDNIGVVGISNVGAEGDTEVENKGVLGRAEGLGVNKAIWGRAMNGVENWAGWFEGDVAVQGGSNLNVYGPNPDDSIKVQLNYFEPNHSGSVLTFGHNKTRRSLIGSDGDKTGGLLHLYDSLDRGVAQLRATRRAGDWVTDQRPHGQLSLWGPESQNFYLGARVWEEDGADAGAMQLFGKPVEDPNNPGVFNPVEGIFMTVQDFGDGQQGMLQLGKEGEGSAILNRDNLLQLTDLVSGQSKHRFEVNGQNSGAIKLMSAVDSVNVLIDSNGEKAGLIHLNDSLGRVNVGLRAHAGGAGYMYHSAGVEGIGETRVTAQYWGGVTPYINLIGRDEAGNATGRAQMGSLEGFAGSGFRITDSNFRWLATVQGDATNGGSMTLEGPNSSNFWLGQKNWENSDLPFMAMRGSQTLTDGAGNTYVPDGLTFEVTGYQDGTENGLINFFRIENGESKAIGLDYSTVNSLVNPESLRVNGPSGNEVVNIGRRGGGNFGEARFLNSNSELRAEIGSFGDDSGFMQLYAPNGSKNIQMGGTDGNRDRGMLRISGTTENNLVNLEVVADEAGTEYGAFYVQNTSGGGFETGSRSWENNGLGGLRSYAALKGTQDVDDGNGGTYRPWLVAQEVHDDGNGEYATLNVNSTNGSNISLNGANGDIYISGVLNQSSDARLKKNVHTLTSGLAIVNKLRGVRYNWKDEARTENKIGFIAQEVEQVLPELVQTREDGFKGVNYAEMTAVLVEAVKELTAQVEALKAENGQLKAEASKVEAMEERLAKIEALLLNNSKVNADQK